MARFEKERDPVEIQEKLYLSGADLRQSSAEDDDLLCVADGEPRQTVGKTTGQRSHARRYSPYPPSSSSSSPPHHHQSNPSTANEKAMKTAPGHKVFVANLAFATTEKILENHMARVGSVVKVLLFKNPNGSSKGMGIVQYRNEESVDRAVSELSDSELDNRRVYVRKHMEEEEREKCGFITINRPIDRPRPPANPSATVFINNLDYNCTWQQIKDVFKAAGKIVYCEVQLDKEGRSKGMASVQYERPIEALNAIALFHGQVLFNRALMVRMDNRSPIKPDSMTIKQLFGGGLNMLNQSAALALLGGGVQGLGMSLLGLPSGLGLGPELLKSLGGAATNGNGVFGGVNISNGGYFPSSSDGSPSPPLTKQRNHTSPLLPSPISPERPILCLNQLTKTNENENTDNTNGSLDVDHTPDRLIGMPNPTPTVNGCLQNADFLYNKAPSSKERRVMIKNLNFKTPWQKLKDLFRSAGRVQFVDVMQGPDGRPNGNAFVLFDKPEEAAKAIEMFHNSELDGRKIDVQLDRLSN